MNLLSHYCRHFTGAFKFKNRQGRTFFWFCLLADVFLVSVLVALSPFGLLGRLLILLALLVIAGNAIQRLKDAGVTPWMLLLWFIPFVGLAILAILLLLPGRKPVDLPAAPPSSPYVGGDFRELKLSQLGHKIRGLQPLLEETQNCRNHPKWQSGRLPQRIKTVAASIDAAWKPLEAARSRLGRSVLLRLLKSKYQYHQLNGQALIRQSNRSSSGTL